MKLFKKQPPQKSVYYTSIHKLPLSRFIDVYVDGDLKALIMEGNPAEQDLQTAWESILEEYGDALASPEQLMYVKKCAELQKRTLTYNVAVALIAVLRKSYVEDFAARLNKIFTTSFKFDISKKDEYLKDLNRCQNRLKEIKIKIDILEGTIQSLVAKYASELKAPSRESFQQALITLSDFAGRELDENTLTVYAYCERLRRYNKWVEQKEREAKKSHSVTR